MNARIGDYVTVLADDQIVHRVGDTPEAQLGSCQRGWFGDVFFDHVRGVIDPNPQRHVEPEPFLLVTHYRDPEWTAQHVTTVKEVASAHALIAEAQRLIAEDDALWEVYGVRIRERRPRSRMRRLTGAMDAGLLAEIRSAPDDDAPRLVWADAVGGERGELVVIQTDLERGGLSPREVIARKRRQRELLARYGAPWSGLTGVARRVSFRRGFVDAAEIAAPAFLAHAEDIAVVAPLLSSLTITDLRADGRASDPIPLLSQLLADPLVRGLHGLELAIGTYDEIDGRTPGELAIEQVVRALGLGQLRALGSRDVLRMPGARALANPRSLHQLERLWLHEVQDLDAMRTVLVGAGLSSLRSLEIGARCPLPEVAALIPPTVTELVVHRLTHDGLAALAASPVAATLECLSASEGNLEWPLFAAFPRLRALAIHHPIAPPPERGAWPRYLPALRELAATVGLREPVVHALADELGPQLELLDLRNSPAALRFVNALKPKVAGELLVGKLETGHPRVGTGLLRVGCTTQMPWWDHLTL